VLSAQFPISPQKEKMGSNLYRLTEKGRKELKILAEKSAIYLPWFQHKKFVNPRIINWLAEGL
jgi:DNA-binding PadR family transcriptional regulator